MFGFCVVAHLRKGDNRSTLHQSVKSQSPDWQKARSLYDSNMPHAVIVKEAGVSLPALKKRIVREKWKVARTEAREIIETQSIQQRGEQLRSRALNECDRDLEVVEQHAPKNLAQAERRQGLLTKVVDNADRLCGWSKWTNPSTVINIANLAAARLADPVPIEVQGIGQAGVIDVKPEVDNGPTPESAAVYAADSSKGDCIRTGRC